MNQFRELRADEIQARVSDRKNGYVNILIYKDARADMNILDETLGQFNWSCQYQELNGVVYCGVAIKGDDGVWVWKWDSGAETNFEKEKGTSSDAFKRACFRWGLGRELYTAPKIRIKDDDSYSYSVTKIAYKDGKISDLRIVNGKGKVVFDYVNFEIKKLASPEEKNTEDVLQTLADICKELQDAGEERKELGKFYRYYEEKLPAFNNPTKQTILRLWEKWNSK